MGMPAVVVGHHRHRHIADLGFTSELRLLQVGHADHVHAPAAIDVRFRLGRKLRALHIQIRSAPLASHACFFAGSLHDLRKLWAYRIGKRNVRDNSVAEKSIHPMSGAVEKLVRDHELQGLVFFFKRTDRRNGHDPLHSQLLKPIHIRPKI